jgi:uncharacterized membrane protein
MNNNQESKRLWQTIIFWCIFAVLFLTGWLILSVLLTLLFPLNGFSHLVRYGFAAFVGVLILGLLILIVRKMKKAIKQPEQSQAYEPIVSD